MRERADEVSPRPQRFVEVGGVAAAPKLAHERVIELERWRQGSQVAILGLGRHVLVPVICGEAEVSGRRGEIEWLTDGADLAACGRHQTDPGGPDRGIQVSRIGGGRPRSTSTA